MNSQKLQIENIKGSQCRARLNRVHSQPLAKAIASLCLCASVLISSAFAQTVTVTLNTNGGTGGTTSVQATVGQFLPTATAPTRTGQMFVGYFDTIAATGGKQYYTSGMSSSSARTWDKPVATTLYARWTPTGTYIVTINANGGINASAVNVGVAANAAMPAMDFGPTYGTWEFQGFFDNAGVSGGIKYYNADLTSAQNWDKTYSTSVYARWGSSITFDKTGGTGGTNSTVVNKGDSMPAGLTAPTKVGARFVGYFDVDGIQYYSNMMASQWTWTLGKPTTLYARWISSSKWDGTADRAWYNASATSFTLTTSEHLAGLAAIVNDGTDSFAGKTINLLVDADLTGKNWIPIGTEERPFAGTFNADSSQITGPTVTATADCVGLFGVVGITGIIKNIYAQGVDVFSTGSSVGAIAGENWGTVLNAIVLGRVESDFGTGGIVGNNDGGRIENVSNLANVYGFDYAGGIAGINQESSTIINSANYGSIVGNYMVGGIVGESNDPTSRIVNVFSTGQVSGASYVGGVTGGNSGIADYFFWNRTYNTSSIGYNTGTVSNTASFIEPPGSLDATVNGDSTLSNALAKWLTNNKAANPNVATWIVGTTSPREYPKLPNVPSAVLPPKITPVSQVFSAASLSVTMACDTAGATIRYTLDGSDPTATSTLYSAAVAVTTSTFVKARAFKVGSVDSPVAAARYMKNNVATTANPTILTNGVPVPNLFNIINQSLYFKITVPAGQGYLDIRTTGGNGSITLLTRNGAAPTASTYVGISTTNYLTTNDRRIRIFNPVAADWWVMIASSTAFSGVQLTVTYSATQNWQAVANRDTTWLGTATALTIANARQLAQFAYLVTTTAAGATQTATFFNGKTITLTADIDLSAYDWISIGSTSRPFTGTFDGAGKKIIGLKINNDVHSFQGLFGFVGKNSTFTGTIKNLTIENTSINAWNTVGAFIARSDGILTNCTVSGTITGRNDIGGLVGYNEASTIENSTNAASVTGKLRVGGIVGDTYNSKVTNTTNNGAVSGESSVGGIVGRNWGGSAVNSINTGAINGILYVGGIAGYNATNSVVKNVSNVGTVEGTTSVGGVIGYNLSSPEYVESVFWKKDGTYKYPPNAVGTGTQPLLAGSFNAAPGTVTPAIFGQTNLSTILNVRAENYSADYPSVWSWTAGSASEYPKLSGIAAAVSPPVFSPSSCEFSDNLTVTITCGTPGVTIRYTTNGTDPTTTSPIAGSSITVSARTTTIKARAFATDGRQSAVATAVYTFATGIIEPLVFTPESGSSGINSLNVKITCATTGVTIRFTTNGTNPTSTSTQYSAAGITITKDTTIKAIATRTNYTDSAMATGVFTIVRGRWETSSNRDITWTATNPNIATAGQLAQFAFLLNNGTDFTGKTITLTADLDITQNYWTPIGSRNASRPFSGIFDGNGKTIKGVVINEPTLDGVGLFGYLTGTVKNLKVTDCDIRGAAGVGGIAGWSYKGIIQNCSNSGAVNGRWNVGGIVGNNDEGQVLACINSGNIFSETCAGGIAGINSEVSEMRNCFNSGAVSANDYAGGLAGTNGSFIINCSNSGEITADSMAGGLAGENNWDAIINCFNSGSVMAADGLVDEEGKIIPGTSTAGGLAGYNTAPLGDVHAIENCYWKKTTALGYDNNAVGDGYTPTIIAHFGNAPGSLDHAIAGQTDLQSALNQWVTANKPTRPDLMNWAGASSSLYPALSSIASIVALPVFSPGSKLSATPIDVTITCTTADATIRYTLDGSTPTTASTLYSGTFTVTTSTTLKARAFKTGSIESGVTSVDYLIGVETVATPRITPVSITSRSPFMATIECGTTGATIRYTLDGSTPTAESPIYPAAGVEITATCTLKAIAFKEGFVESALATANYEIIPPDVVATPVLVPGSFSSNFPITVTINCATANAEIYYTTNGLNPDSSSRRYTAPFIVSEDLTVKAIAIKPDYIDSAMASATYTIVPDGTVTDPIITPASMQFSDPVLVSIFCSTPSSTIHYTTNGTVPTTASPIYTTPFQIATNTTVCALAVKDGWVDSAVSTATYTIIDPDRVIEPVFSPSGRTSTKPITVSMLSATAGSGIYYTTDGTTPSKASTLYIQPIEISANTTLKAFAVKDGMTDSVVTTEIYTIDPYGPLDAPVITPPSRDSSEAVTVTITAEDGASIYYTLDESTPNEYSIRYTTPFVLTVTATVKAIATKSSRADSPIAAVRYTIDIPPPAATPTITPASIQTIEPITVIITCATPGAAIHYTLDGTTPTQTSSLYMGSFLLNETCTVKARAFREGLSGSVVATATYTFIPLYNRDMGVNCETILVKTPALGEKLSAKGLPSGLKFDAKTGIITGIPKKAGEKYLVTITSKLAGVTTTTDIAITVGALPLSMQGTFTGYLYAEGGDETLPLGLFSMTASKAGALSAKVTLFAEGKLATYSMKASCWSDILLDTMYRANLTLVKKSITQISLAFAADLPDPADADAWKSLDAARGHITLLDGRKFSLVTQRNYFLDKAVKPDITTPALDYLNRYVKTPWKGVYTLLWSSTKPPVLTPYKTSAKEILTDESYLYITVKAKGAVSLSGFYYQGINPANLKPIYFKASASTTLLVDGEQTIFSTDEGIIPFYFFDKKTIKEYSDIIVLPNP